MEEAGGINLYGFVNDDPANAFDVLGEYISEAQLQNVQGARGIEEFWQNTQASEQGLTNGVESSFQSLVYNTAHDFSINQNANRAQAEANARYLLTLQTSRTTGSGGGGGQWVLRSDGVWVYRLDPFTVASRTTNSTSVVTIAPNNGGPQQVDVYVWNGSVTNESVGHVMITEHNSTNVILSQFPANGAATGPNTTLTYGQTFKSEGYDPSSRYVVTISDPTAFNSAVQQARAAPTWSWDPQGPSQTQCSTAACNALVAGGTGSLAVMGALSGYQGGTLPPIELNTWLWVASKTTSTVTQVDPLHGR